MKSTNQCRAISNAFECRRGGLTLVRFSKETRRSHGARRFSHSFRNELGRSPASCGSPSHLLEAPDFGRAFTLMVEIHSLATSPALLL